MFYSKTRACIVILSCFVAFSIGTTSFAVTLKTNKNITETQGSLQEIAALIKQKKYKDAYQLAQSISDQEIGNAAYDSLLGQAAMSMKKYDVAALAFERVLMSNPQDVNARLSLARSYCELKMYNVAKSEVQTLNKKKHELALNNEIKYLSDKIEQNLKAKNSEYTVYGGIAFGYDNNVAATSDEDYSRFPDITGMSASIEGHNRDQATLLENLRNQLSEKYNEKYKSNYAYPRLGLRATYNPTARFNFYWDINGSHKKYTSTDNFNVSQGNLSVGANYQLAPTYLLNAALYYQEYLLDGKRYRQVPMGTLGLGKLVNPHNNLKLYTDIGSLIYPSNRALTVNMFIGGLEWAYFDDYRFLITQLFYGRNQPLGPNAAKSNGSNYYGANISAKHKITKKLDLTAGFSYQNSLYDRKEYLNAPRRRDPFYQYTAGIYYQLHPNYTWYALTSYTRNQSSIFVYEYKRLETVTGINFEF